MFFCFRIIGQLPVVRLCVRPCPHPLSCFPHPVAQCRAPFFQLCQTAVVVLALSKIVLILRTVPVVFRLCRKNAQCLFLCFDLFHRIAFQPCAAFFLKFPPLLIQPLLFAAQLCQLVCLLFQRKPHCFLHSCIVFLAFASILCYTLVRDLRPAAPRIFGFHVGFAEGLYFCLYKIHDIIKNLFCVWFDCSQNIGFVCVFAHLHSDLPTVECLCVFVVSRFAVNLVCRCNNFIQISRHPHLVCIGCPVFPL